MRQVLTAVLALAVLGAVVVNASAASYTLYGSISDNDTVTNNMIGLYLNSEDYDPYNEYILCRVGQYDYYLFYGKSLLEDYKYFRYYGTQSGYSVNWNYGTGEGSNLHINQNGYVGVGNVAGSVLSDKGSQFGFGYVLTVLLILLTILMIFKTFRKHYSVRSDRRYTLT